MKNKINKVWDKAVSTPKTVARKTKNIAKKVIGFYEGRLESARKGKQDNIKKHINDLKTKGMLPKDSYND